MQNNRYKITFISTLLLIIVLFLLFIPYLFDNPKKSIIEEYNSDKSYFSLDKNSKIKGGFKFYDENCVDWDIVLTKFDLVKPKYTLLCNFDGKNNDVIVVELNRKNIFFWEVINTTGATIKNKIFKDALKIVQENDLSSTNPDSTSISVFPSR